MAINKINYYGETLIDLTGDTVTAADVAKGKTFHSKSGVRTTGTYELKCVIVVTAPTGSSVTCKKGTTTKTASEKNGTWTFAGLDVGTWTVTATLGANTGSKPVTLTVLGEAAGVKFEFSYYLYKNGDEFVERTGGWISKAMGVNATYPDGHVLEITRNATNIKAQSPDTQSARTGIIICKNKIDLTAISLIKATCWATSNKTNDFSGVSLQILSKDSGGYLNTLSVASVAINSGNSVERTIDTSKLSGEFFIGFSVYTYGWIKSANFSMVYCQA